MKQTRYLPITGHQEDDVAKPHVLIVEDDADINQIVALHLARQGYTCTQAFSGTEARLLLDQTRTHGADDKSAQGRGSNGRPSPDARRPSAFDLVICDLMLPGITGEELIALIRANDPHVPIIVTSARTATSDKVDLLRLGADDYLAKPFDLDELTARIAVQFRHRATDSADHSGSATHTFPERTLIFRSWILDPAARTFTVDGSEIDLTRIDFNILEVLMHHPQRVFSKQELFERAWGEPYAVDDNTVTVHVSNIRSKLKASGTDTYIKTVWGMGFKLIGE